MLWFTQDYGTAAQDRGHGRTLPQRGQILELAGCDLLTISLQLLGELKTAPRQMTRKLSPNIAARSDIPKARPRRKKLRWLLSEGASATGLWRESPVVCPKVTPCQLVSTAFTKGE